MDTPLYNSRIIKSFVEYSKHNYPDIDIDFVMSESQITTYQMEDQGHWFSQRQVDRFHELMAEETGNPNLAREAGRYSATSKSLGAVRQYALGFMTPAAAYWVLERIVPHITRASVMKARKLGRNRLEVQAIPNHDVSEKPYQCENRMGMLEAIPRLFTNKFAKIEHSTCIHKGGATCKYIITWEKVPFFMSVRVRSYFYTFGLLGCAALYYLGSPVFWSTLVFLLISTILGFAVHSERIEIEELERNIQVQRDAAELLLDQINIRYNTAELVKEIGQATVILLDIRKLLESIIRAMKERLDFNRGGIWLANEEKTRLIYNMGYGYDPEIKRLLADTAFHLDNPSSKGVAIQAFRDQTPFLVNDITEIENDLSERTLNFVKQVGSRSFICVPIAYEGESLGVLLVDNIKSKRPLGQSDMSLLMGIAPQIAISIHNALSYQKLLESRERESSLRRLFEKYVPAPIIKRCTNLGDTDLLHGEEIPITVFFLDIRRFTSSSETIEPKEVVSFLNTFFEQCANIVNRENGHINKYTGDGFLTIFGAPEPLEAHAVSAFKAACSILEISGDFNLGGSPMEVGIGLYTGKAILGNIGSRSKIEYTAIGDTVNMAARLEEITKVFLDYPIIMGIDTWHRLSVHPYYKDIKYLGEHEIRGRKEAVELFGYRSSERSGFQGNQSEMGFLPLQKISGV